MSCWDRDYRNKVGGGWGRGGVFLLGVFFWRGRAFFLAICSQLSSSLSPHPQRTCIIRKKHCHRVMTSEIKLGIHGLNIN